MRDTMPALTMPHRRRGDWKEPKGLFRIIQPSCDGCRLDYFERAMCACDTCRGHFRTVRLGLAAGALLVLAVIAAAFIYVYA